MDLAKALPEVQRLVGPTASDRGVGISVVPCEGPVSVRANEAQLQQVLLDLVLNGVQACERGGHVQLGVQADGMVRVEVRDTGCGIPVGEQERIFDPFVSLRPGGTGLGLVLARDLARRWNAELGVASVPGEGSCFSIVFPVPAPPTAGGEVQHG